uniref:Uncharacterized protein n=1 Tax=Caenorhabditis tropicalis TaxID=1561998 RepID=A0A1I7T953_9PELO
MGIHPTDLIALQKKTPAEREKILQEQQKLLHSLVSTHQSNQHPHQSHAAQQEPKSKRKSGIESITSMQAAPQRHIQLAGSSSRIQANRGVSPALSTKSMSSITGAGRSITAGTSGHAFASLESNNKNSAVDLMKDLSKLMNQKQLEAKVNSTNSNAVSPANTNNSDDIEVVWQGTATKPVTERSQVRRLQASEVIRSGTGQKVKQILSIPKRANKLPPVNNEEEAMEALSIILSDEAKRGEKTYTSVIAAKEGTPNTSYLDIYAEILKLDEERIRSETVARNTMSQRDHEALLAALRHNPHFLQQFSRMSQALQGRNVVDQAQQSNKLDNYEKFNLLRPDGISRPTPSAGPMMSNLNASPAISTVSASASVPHFSRQGPSIATVQSTTSPHPISSPSVAVQTAPPASHTIQSISGNSSSLNSNISDASSEDVNLPKNRLVIPSNRLPPAPGDKTAYRSIIDFRASGEVAVYKYRPAKYPLTENPQNKMPVSTRPYTGPYKNIVYEDLSDDE